MLLRGDEVSQPGAAEPARDDHEAADPLVDVFAPLCAEGEALCRRLDPGLRRVDALCAGLGGLVVRLTTELGRRDARRRP